MAAPPPPADPLDSEFEHLERRLAARDLQEIKARSRRRLLALAAVAAVVALVILGAKALLKQSPCVELLEAAESRRLDAEWERDADLTPGACYATLSGKDRRPKLRVFANAGPDERQVELAMAVLRAQSFERFEPLGVGDDGLLAIAKPSKSSGRDGPRDAPGWMAGPTAASPFVHVAVFQKGLVTVTVELDPHSFDADEAAELVESMRPALSELRRLAPR